VRLACEGDSVSSGNVLIAGSEDHLVFKNSHELGYTAEPKEKSLPSFRRCVSSAVQRASFEDRLQLSF